MLNALANLIAQFAFLGFSCHAFSADGDDLGKVVPTSDLSGAEQLCFYTADTSRAIGLDVTWRADQGTLHILLTEDGYPVGGMRTPDYSVVVAYNTVGPKLAGAAAGAYRMALK